MTVSFDSIALLVVVAFLWGVTNPLLKRGVSGLENVKASTRFRQCIKEFIFLVTNLQYIIPFAFNQIGSVLYISTLGSIDLSLAVPLSNSLTFVITAITGWIFGEEKVNRNTYIGMILILLGILLCSLDKVEHKMSVES